MPSHRVGPGNRAGGFDILVLTALGIPRIGETPTLLESIAIGDEEGVGEALGFGVGLGADGFDVFENFREGFHERRVLVGGPEDDATAGMEGGFDSD